MRIALAILALPGGLLAQSPVTLVALTAGDTATVETYTRTADGITGDIRFVRQNATTHYVVTLQKDGTAEHAEVTNTSPDGTRNNISYDFGADSVRVRDGDGSHSTVVPSGSKAFAWMASSFALIEQMIRATAPAVGDSVVVTGINIRQGGAATPVLVRRLKSDSVRVLQHTLVKISPQMDLLGAFVTGSGLTIVRK